MADNETVLHLLSREAEWEETCYVVALAERQKHCGWETLIVAPPESWTATNAPTRGIKVDTLALTNSLNPLSWHRLSSLAKAASAAVIHAHDRLARAVLSRSRVGDCRRVASVYRPTVGREGALAKLDRVFYASRFAAGDADPADDGANARVVACGADMDVAQAEAEKRDAARAEMRQEFSPDIDKPIFIASFGELGKHSRHQTLVEAMPDIVAKLPQTHLLLVGDGEQYAELARQARIMALEKHVSFVEPDLAYPALLAGCDVYVSPRADDGAGIMVQAAMAAGRAVVADAAGCHPELIDPDKNGILVPENGPPAVGEAILDLLQNRTRRDHLGRMAAARAAKAGGLAAAAQTMFAAYAGE